MAKEHGLIDKSAALNEGIWDEFMKQANLATTVKNVAKKAKNIAKPTMGGVAHPTVAPSDGILNYAKIRAEEIAKKRAQPSATLSYSKGQSPVYTAPGKSIEESKAIAQAKVKEQSQNRMTHAMKGGYTDPQIRRYL